GQIDPPLFRFVCERLYPWRLSDSEAISDLRGLVDRQILYKSKVVPSYWSDGLVQRPDVLDECLRRIENYEPYVVKALPIYLYLLAIHIQETVRRPPRIRGGLMPMGSSMTPHMKAVVEEAFDCSVHEDYGCSELGSIASECGRQNGLHPFTGMV